MEGVSKAQPSYQERVTGSRAGLPVSPFLLHGHLPERLYFRELQVKSLWLELRGEGQVGRCLSPTACGSACS